MGNAITDYSLVIIEDTQVPLAPTFSTGASNVPVIVAIVLMTVLVAIFAYTAWYISHRSRLMAIVSRTEEKSLDDGLYLYTHPRRLLQLEYEIEHKIVNKFVA